MKIREYLDHFHSTLKQMSREIGISECYLWRVDKGLNNPSALLATQIESWSNGRIKVSDIRKCTRHCGKNCECSKRES